METATQEGIFTAPTTISETANDTRKMLVILRKGWYVQNTKTTIMLPTRAVKTIKDKHDVNMIFSVGIADGSSGEITGNVSLFIIQIPVSKVRYNNKTDFPRVR